jgi:hypothetical protein
MSDIIPTVYATRKGAQLVFKCVKCGEVHYHGLGDGHRSAHCDEWEDGYILKEKV